MQTRNVQQSACNLKRQITQLEKMLYKSKPFHTKANVLYKANFWICRDINSYNDGRSQLSMDALKPHIVRF